MHARIDAGMLSGFAARWTRESGDPIPSPMGRMGSPRQAYCFLPIASFLHSERNFLRSLPCNPLASACLEHSTDSALRGLAVLAMGAAASDLAAGAALVCANAGAANSRKDAPRAAAKREEIVMRCTSGLRIGRHGCAIMLNRG